MTRLSVTAGCLRALALAGAMLAPAAASATPVLVEVADYVASEGRSSYFFGKLLTENDLNEEQSYKRGADTYIGPSGLSLGELFQAIGTGGLGLSFDDSDASGDNRSDPTNANDPHGDDFIVLDPDNGTWRGRLYLAGSQTIVAGVYDNLAGDFERLVIVPEPTSIALLAIGVAGIAGARVRRRLRAGQRAG